MSYFHYFYENNLFIKIMFLHLHCNYENIEIMTDTKKDIIWSTENLVMFGMWLESKGEYGYGLLCIHGSCLGIKIGGLLKLTWGDFIYDFALHSDEEDEFPCRKELSIINEKKDGKKIIELSPFIQRYTSNVYRKNLEYHSLDANKPIYINEKTGKVLTTSSLNRELNKLYEQYKLEIYSRTYLEISFRELKTNTFEIAWGRDMVHKYNYTKKIFIAVSKYMGHRTVNDTINLFEIEPKEEIKFSYDMFNPDFKTEMDMETTLFDNYNLGIYLLKNDLGFKSDEFITRSKKQVNYDVTDRKFWD
jgi:hypothetical protein